MLAWGAAHNLSEALNAQGLGGNRGAVASTLRDQWTASVKGHINAQLKENERAREIERQRREAVKREAQADARRVAAAVRAEKVAAREKKERDRKMFDEQAKAYAAQRARQRAAEEAAERVEVDAAKASLLAEERKNARLKKSFQAEQERLAREIIVARKHKEEQKLAEWRENARIDREAREAQDETERRRAMVKAQRDARIARFQSNFAQGAGKEQADAAAAEDAMIRRYLEKQAQAIEDRHRSDLAKIADTNAKIKAENDSQLARKARDRAAAAAARRRDFERVQAAQQRLREETAAAARDKLARQRRFVGILQEQSRAVAQRREAEKVVMTAAERSLNGSIIDTFAKASPERKAKIRERM